VTKPHGKSFIARKGERTLVRYSVSPSFATGLGSGPRFAAERLADGGDPSGTVEVLRSTFLSRGSAERHALARCQAFAMPYRVTDYSIYVTPDEDVTITLPSGRIWSTLLAFAFTAAFIAFMTWEAVNWLWMGR
jgi:hypothetical protein